MRKRKSNGIATVIFCMGVLLCTSSCEDDPLLKTPFVIVRSAADILPVSGKWVKPVIYFNEFSFDELSLKKKKKKFIDMLLPSVLQVKHNIAIDRKRIGDIIWSQQNNEQVPEADSLFLTDYMSRFEAKDANDLYNRLATHPTSIVLAQAAVESGWGTSRFFVEGNNIFGIWSYSSEEERMQALHNRGDQSIYVRSYKDINGSIEDYFYMLARSSAYKEFRKERVKPKEPTKLTYFLKNYSELRYTYVSRLNMLINKNNLTQYDSLTLDPSYYHEGEKLLPN
ncbi:glucosaminidase domain-containing protein [Fulvivirga maritima]|uniref:glucosaminidase domain-containing protein n=1 Tax=Fulvivirga maritima TaxID=2904247 RepID=UPI001F193F1B|nr:glucosaminidase domain-containing protein [Fulvivirga maritima]UII25265.1 glucosaminidase domain-containing protein [Fulvivirga maritima]